MRSWLFRHWQSLLAAVIGFTLVALVLLGGAGAIVKPGPTFDTLTALSPASTVSESSGELLLVTVTVDQDVSATEFIQCVWFNPDCSVADTNPAQRATESRDTSNTNVAKAAAQTTGTPASFAVGLNAVQGSSGGLVSTLAVTAAETNTVPVALGRKVAVTGTVTDTGSVTPVGGVDMKTRSVIAAGASAFLVPAENADTAQQVVNESHASLTIVPIASVSQAWSWLCTNAGGHGPLCAAAAGEQRPVK